MYPPISTAITPFDHPRLIGLNIIHHPDIQQLIKNTIFNTPSPQNNTPNPSIANPSRHLQGQPNPFLHPTPANVLKTIHLQIQNRQRHPHYNRPNHPLRFSLSQNRMESDDSSPTTHYSTSAFTPTPTTFQISSRTSMPYHPPHITVTSDSQWASPPHP
eukprot:GHVP01029346.1.p1 GENE.GHVP01029346.1~~GHVP01029346.1.p1  ORF type:complete len:159 (-),score=5.53 GHVP01029346.1:245-721(-)